MSCSQLVIIFMVGSFIAAVIMPLIVFCLSLCFKSCCKCQNSSPSKPSTQDLNKSESCVVNTNNYYHSPAHGVFTHCNIPNSIRAGTNSIPNSNNQCIFVNFGSIDSLISSSSGSYFFGSAEFCWLFVCFLISESFSLSKILFSFKYISECCYLSRILFSFY